MYESRYASVLVEKVIRYNILEAITKFGNFTLGIHWDKVIFTGCNSRLIWYMSCIYSYIFIV